MVVLRLLQRNESAAMLYDCDSVKFSISDTFLKPVLSSLLLTLASRLLAMLNETVPVLPVPGVPYSELEK